MSKLLNLDSVAEISGVVRVGAHSLRPVAARLAKIAEVKASASSAGEGLSGGLGEIDKKAKKGSKKIDKTEQNCHIGKLI